MIAVLVITDGRLDYLKECVKSLHANLDGPITERWLYDDTGDEEHRDVLRGLFPEFTHINGGPRQGFGGAIRAAWATIRCESQARYIAHIEQDFTFNRPVDLRGMARVLDMHPHLVQLALRRQPWNDHERLAGGIVEQHPDAYTERAAFGYEWLEHRLFFTTNPSLYRRTLCTTNWPEGGNSEGHFTHQILSQGTPETEGESVRFGYWGNLQSGEAVTHIGHQRAGVGY